MVNARSSCAVKATCQWRSPVSGAAQDPRGLPRADDSRRVLADAPAGCLYKALVEPGKAAAVFPAQIQLQDPGMAGFAAQVRDGSPLEPVLSTLLEIVEKSAAKPVTPEEVERARNQILKQIELSLNNSEVVGLTLSDWEGMGDWRLMFINRDRLKKVSADDVQRVWVKYFKPANRTVGLFYPTKNPERVETPGAARRAGPGQGLQGRHRARAGRGVRRFTGEHRGAHHAPRVARRSADCPCFPRRPAAARCSSGWRCVSAISRALANQGEVSDPSPTTLADARHDQTHAPAIAGRAGSTQGARQHERLGLGPVPCTSRPRAKTCPP